MDVETILKDRYQIRFSLSNKLGRKTFLALDLQTQTLVIIKIIQFNVGFEWEDFKLFEREATILKHINHPAIPKYLDYFDVEAGFALVQTYIDAPSLETAIADGRKFTEVEAIELADRLLDILSYLHSQHPPIIHRDLKPSNILLGNRSGNSIGDVYLVDFGSVQAVGAKDGSTMTIVGTPGFMPLEQFYGQATMASDLYSLGMTLIYLLTGKFPDNLPQINDRLKLQVAINNQLRRWLEKMTKPELEKRFASAEIAQIALHSDDGSYGDFQHLKPANTQVRLSRDLDKLEITWRDTNIEARSEIGALASFPLMALFLFVLVYLSIYILKIALDYDILISFLNITIQICGLLLALTLIGFGLTQIVKPFIPDVDYQIAIDDRYIYKLKVRGRNQQPIILSARPRSQIETLAYNPGYTFDKCLDSNGALVSGSTITIPPKLYLYCSDVEYRFSDRLSQAELWWLGKELSDFLNLELQVIYPTPKIPAAPSCGGGC